MNASSYEGELRGKINVKSVKLIAVGCEAYPLAGLELPARVWQRSIVDPSEVERTDTVHFCNSELLSFFNCFLKNWFGSHFIKFG